MTPEPLVKVVKVAVARDRAFAAFTAEMGAWWPLRTHSVGGEDSRGLALEPAVGGRIVERLGDGSACVWGTVTAWEPPARVAFTWHPGRGSGEATRVEVTFSEETDGTAIRLTHDGWRDGDERRRDEYATGWPRVLGALGERLAEPFVLFLVEHAPGPAWQHGRPLREQTGVELHVGFLRTLLDQGRLVMGGPFLDDRGGGAAVVYARSAEDVEELMGRDPSIAAGLLVADARPWMIGMAGPR